MVQSGCLAPARVQPPPVRQPLSGRVAAWAGANDSQKDEFHFARLAYMVDELPAGIPTHPERPGSAFGPVPN